MKGHTVQWVAPSPLWPEAAGDAAPDRERMRRPALLRFASDTFMEELAALLADDPGRLSSVEAKRVSFRPPPPGEPAPSAPDRLKLFQPVHGHFNLVSASLVCRLPGLPQHSADPSRREQVAFVLRRLSDDGEWAWAGDPDEPTARGWLAVPDGAEEAVQEREDLLPLFPVSFAETEERSRQLYVGLVPTSSIESFRGAGELSPFTPPGSEPGAPAADQRPFQLELKVVRPMVALRTPPSAPSSLKGAELVAAQQADERQRVEATTFVLLELAAFLREHVRALWQRLESGTAPPGGPALALYQELDTRRVDARAVTSWRSALLTAWDERLAILGEDPTGEEDASLSLNAARTTLPAESLDSLVRAVLPPLPADAPAGPGAPPPGPGEAGPAEAPAVPKLDARADTTYLVRCVYRRPECGPLHPDLVSEPSEVFTIAPFFDVDAPGREIRITLPVDTSPKDLRKFAKNVSFLLSDQLRQQMSRVTDLKQAMDGNLGSGQRFDVGMMCSFSIPIITICALIVLMLFVALLNLVFWWLPILRICFPIGLKAK